MAHGASHHLINSSVVNSIHEFRIDHIPAIPKLWTFAKAIALPIVRSL
jgi:hypothetical protein